MDIYIPTTDAARYVKVSATYDRFRKCISYAAYPAEATAHGNYIVTITAGLYLRGETLARNSKTKVAAAQQNAAAQVQQKSGPVWDLVVQLCQRDNLTLS